MRECPPWKEVSRAQICRSFPWKVTVQRGEGRQGQQLKDQNEGRTVRGQWKVERERKKFGRESAKSAKGTLPQWAPRSEQVSRPRRGSLHGPHSCLAGFAALRNTDLE